MIFIIVNYYWFFTTNVWLICLNEKKNSKKINEKSKIVDKKKWKFAIVVNKVLLIIVIDCDFINCRFVDLKNEREKANDFDLLVVKSLFFEIAQQRNKFV